MAKPYSYLGVDLSPDSIKIVELTVEAGKPKLVTYGYTESRSDVLRGDFINNRNLTSTLLKEVADRAKVTTNFASAALPISSVFSTVIKLSNLQRRDLENKAKIKPLLIEELKKIMPRPIEEVIFDFNLIVDEEIENPDSGPKIPVARYLVTASILEVVKTYVDIFKQSNFQLTNLDIETFALVRSLVGTDKSLILLVDIGENLTTLSIVNYAMPLLNRTINYGGGVITKKIADTLNITIAEAENYKLDMAILMQQENLSNYPQLVEDALAPLVSEIKYLLKTYYDQMGQQKILDKVILTGGGSLLGNYLDKYLTNVLNLRAYIGDPWARVIYPQELRPVLTEVGPRFAVALGLAMRDII
ncbi:MAG: type IV pilus assembly protein PilM [Candidatus Parcubacteria bacterium]|nr:type IV pilus assembly protein PilM [Candidatus Parcubacteria bacterium]